jgi:hypothetical protein
MKNFLILNPIKRLKLEINLLRMRLKEKSKLNQKAEIVKLKEQISEDEEKVQLLQLRLKKKQLKQKKKKIKKKLRN